MGPWGVSLGNMAFAVVLLEVRIKLLCFFSSVGHQISEDTIASTCMSLIVFVVTCTISVSPPNNPEGRDG
jgi:hypothetical protein